MLKFKDKDGKIRFIMLDGEMAEVTDSLVKLLKEMGIDIEKAESPSKKIKGIILNGISQDDISYLLD